MNVRELIGLSLEKLTIYELLEYCMSYLSIVWYCYIPNYLDLAHVHYDVILSSNVEKIYNDKRFKPHVFKFKHMCFFVSNVLVSMFIMHKSNSFNLQ